MAPRAQAIGVLVVLGIGTSASAVRASPEDVFGFGPRSMAMGATGTADGHGFETVYANPALLSLARRRELTLGFQGAIFDLHAGRRISYEALRGSLIGVTLPLPLGGVLRNRLAVGLGFFAPFDLVVRGRILYPESPQFLLADRTQSVAVQAGLGVDVGHGIRIGGGFAALAALTGSVEVATDASGRIGTVVEDTLVASYGPIVGASYDVDESWRVGLVFRGKLEGRFNVVITVEDIGEIVVPPLNISGVAQYDPWQVAAEVAHARGPWRFAVGATFKHWSAYPGPVEATVRCPSPDEVPDAPESCAALVPADPDYHDTLVPRLGVERAIPLRPGATARLRAGYFFEPSAAPAQERESNHYDSSRSVLTAGYGLALDQPLPALAFDLFAQLHVLHPRAHVKDAGVPRDNPGAPGADSTGFVFATGMTLGVGF